MKTMRFIRDWILWFCILWIITDVAITAYYDVHLSPFTVLAIIIGGLALRPKDTP